MEFPSISDFHLRIHDSRSQPRFKCQLHTVPSLFYEHKTAKIGVNLKEGKMLDQILTIVDSLRIDKAKTLSGTSSLIGSERVLDSLLLVELCLRLEDLATELNFTFDWTSTEAMSRSGSMFRTVDSLVEEFENQLNKAK